MRSYYAIRHSAQARAYRMLSFSLTVLWLTLLASSCSTLRAQTLDVTATHGRVYNIATGTWTIASVPGVEFCAAGLTVSGSWWFDLQQGGYFEQDWSVAWEKTWRDRFTLIVTGAVYRFRDLGTDKIWMVETRYRIFGRH